MEDAIVVGAGQAGLGISRLLVERGVPDVVLERGRVGETWRTQRWDSFTLNTPNWLNRMPGDEVDIAPRDGFLALHPWIERMDAYAATHALPIRTGSDVTRVEGRPDGAFFVQTRVGHATYETLEARTVVVASGIQRVSRMPRIARSLPLLETLSIHTAHYLNPSQLPPGGVLVVGRGSRARRSPRSSSSPAGPSTCRPAASLASAVDTAAGTSWSGSPSPASSTSVWRTCRTRR